MSASRWVSFFFAAALVLPATGYTGAITTPEIVAKTTAAAFSCMQWMPIGTCFWLQCSLFGCSVRTSLKVGHYNPNLVVSSYNELGGNPWTEIRATLGLPRPESCSEWLARFIIAGAHRQCR
jgi:hypothetical protein